MTLDGTRKGKSAWYALGFYDGGHNLPAYGPDHEPDRIEKPEDLAEYLRGYRAAEAKRAFARESKEASKALNSRSHGKAAPMGRGIRSMLSLGALGLGNRRSSRS